LNGCRTRDRSLAVLYSPTSRALRYRAKMNTDADDQVALWNALTEGLATVSSALLRWLTEGDATDINPLLQSLTEEDITVINALIQCLRGAVGRDAQLMNE